MGRPSLYNKRKLASFDPKTRISRCLVCDKPMKGNLLGNIKRHYIRIHNYSFEEGVDAPYMNPNVKRIEKAPKEQRYRIVNQIASGNTTRTYDGGYEATSSSSFTYGGPNSAAVTAASSSMVVACQSNATFKLNKNDFLKCCVGLVGELNIPFRLFDDNKYFKRIIEPYENAYNINLDAIKVEDLSNNFAVEIKHYIRALLHKKLLALKVEIATKRERSIAALNVQFIRDFRLQNVTIAVVELKKRNFGECLKNEIFKIFNDYGIDVHQIYAFTTINASSCLNGMQQLQNELLRLQDFENAESCNDTGDDDDDEETAEEAAIEVENFTKTEMKLQEYFANYSYVAQTPKLVAHDFFEIFHAPIDVCRIKVRNLRLQIQESNQLRKPFVDRANSWYTTFHMLESLLFLKDFIIADEIETSLDWHFIEQCLEALRPLVDCAQQLQSEQYIVGDYFRDWLLCETKLEQIIENTCAKHLYGRMQRRKMELMDNEMFLAALYFDPRFNFMGSPFFDDDKRRTAVVYIMDLHTRLTVLQGAATGTGANVDTLNNESFEQNNPLDETVNNSILPAAQDDPYGALELKLSMSTTLPLADNNCKISQKIENLSYGQRMPFSTNILDYWKMLAFKEKELAQLAQTVFALPANQYSIGRACNALATILSNQHLNLNAQTIQNMSFIKLNDDIFGVI